MFPTAHSRIYRNEAGEVTGWDNGYGEETYEPDDPTYLDGPHHPKCRCIECFDGPDEEEEMP